MKTAQTIDDYHRLPLQELTVSSIPNGSVLDIGGGGEGVIAQIGRERITAIDKLESEIKEAQPNAPEAKWVVADASKLDFPDNYFDNATAFFSGMYMTLETLKDVFLEVNRLIPMKGEFWVWDAAIDYEIGPFIIPLKIKLNDEKIIETGYGRRTVQRDRSVNDVVQILQNIGFKVRIISSTKYWYFLKAIKI